MEAAVKVSEVRYRRLFETAKDGILILDADTAKITDANPFIAELLGYSHADLIGKELWQIGLFKDMEESKAAMRELQENRYIRYEDMPLETKEGRRIDVEFVSNVYREGHQSVIQCNIRDITERKRLENELQQIAAEMSEADRRKDEFLAMLAHELRNPLAPIRNALQIMRLTGGNAAGRRFGVRDDGTSGRSDGPVGGRLARCEPHQPWQDRTSQGADRTGIRRQPRRRSCPLASTAHGA